MILHKRQIINIKKIKKKSGFKNGLNLKTDKGNRINILNACLSLLQTSKNFSDKLKFHHLKYKEENM